MDYGKAAEAIHNTILQVGSEFRPIDDLKSIFQHHKDWKKLERLLTKGVVYGFDPSIDYTDKMRKEDLEAAIKKGNNKSAQDPAMQEIIHDNYKKEVTKAWMIPFLKSCVIKVVGAGVIPVGIAQQWTMNEKGERIRKNRTTHDFSNKMKSGYSWNSLVNKTLLDKCLFGSCLIRVLHQIHDIRYRYPDINILLNKIDLDAAFRRLHLCYEHAVLGITILDDIAYILNRLPFGSNEGPGKHDIPSNMIVELAQLIIDDPTWNPDELFSPRSADIPEDENLDASIPHGKAHPLAITFDEQKDCYVDGYIDDLATVVAQLNGIPDRGRHAVALALHSFFRPANKNDPLPCDDILSARKLSAEGGLSETKRFLGWFIDTRRFIIKLTSDKSARWGDDLEELIAKTRRKEKVTTTEIESTIGRLNTAAYICTEGRFFLARLRHCLKVSKSQKGSMLLPEKVLLDLELWKKMLTSLSTKGRSINLVTYTLPSFFTKQDACEDALGGFIDNGLAWRYIIPPELRGLVHINILEFLASLITTWLSILFFEFDPSIGIKFLAQTDNTSALGWMYGSCCYDSKSQLNNILKELIGRKFAEILLDAGMSHYSQHVKGESNVIADHLSCNIEMSNSEQIASILLQWGDEAPDNLRIVELPQEILSWISLFWEIVIRSAVLPKAQRKRMRAASENGQQWQPTTTLTFTSEKSRNSRRSRSSVLSRTPSDITLLGQRLKMNLEDPRFVPSSTLYQRRSDQWDFQTQLFDDRQAFHLVAVRNCIPIAPSFLKQVWENDAQVGIALVTAFINWVKEHGYDCTSSGKPSRSLLRFLS